MGEVSQTQSNGSSTGPIRPYPNKEQFSQGICFPTKKKIVYSPILIKFGMKVGLGTQQQENTDVWLPWQWLLRVPKKHSPGSYVPFMTIGFFMKVMWSGGKRMWGYLLPCKPICCHGNHKNELFNQFDICCDKAMSIWFGKAWPDVREYGNQCVATAIAH